MKSVPIAILSWFLVLLPTCVFATSSYPPPANIRVTNYPQLNNEEQVWICPTDSNNIIAVWRDFRLGYRQVGIGHSIDGGLNWSDSLINQDMQAYPFLSKQSDPTLTVDRLGNYYISVLDYDPDGITNHSYITFYKSIDKGATWTGPVFHIPALDTNVFEDKQFITIDRTGGTYDGNIYCTWARYTGPYINYSGPIRIAFVRSTDGGASFEDTIIVGPPQTTGSCSPNFSAGHFPIPMVSSNGDVHVFYMGYVIDSSISCNINWGLKHVVSTDGGQTFGASDDILLVSGWSALASGIAVYSNPAADADISGGPFDGNIYIAFTNYELDAPGAFDVDFVRSTDNALSWSEKYQINDDTLANNCQSFHPWLIVNEEGVVIVIYYDTRFDYPFDTNFDLMASYSFDGGETFTSNHRISEVSSYPGFLKRELGETNQFNFDESNPLPAPLTSSRAGLIGEYIGVTAYHDKINAVWTDARDFNSEVYTANWYLPILEARLISPEDSFITGTEPMFTWATAWKHDQDRYRFEICSDSTFSTGVNSKIIDTNFVIIDSALTDGAYYWRVKSLMVSGLDSSEYSLVRTLIIDKTGPAQAMLLLPPDGDTISVAYPLFDWSDVSKSAAITYELQLSSDSTFPVGPLTTVYAGLVQSELKVPDSLESFITTYWRVLASDDAGNVSISETFSVTFFSFLCGDVNNDGDAANILDLTFLVDFIFRGGPLPPVIPAADLDGSGGNPNIIDLTTLVDFIFRGGAFPTCGL